jgi:ribonucleoside-diphosphate reductase alpha chain
MAANPKMCQRKPDGKWVVEFPVQAPDGAILKGDQSAMQFLDAVRSTQVNWVVPGTDRMHPGYNGGHHNVSNTVTVQPDEWEAVASYIWAHRDDFTGISLLPASADKDYAFAPLEAVTTEADERRWLELVSCYKPIDYTAILETEDGTVLSAESACAGGFCQIV